MQPCGQVAKSIYSAQGRGGSQCEWVDNQWALNESSQMKQLLSLPFQKLQDLGKGCERVSNVLSLGELPKGCQIKAGRAQWTPKL